MNKTEKSLVRKNSFGICFLILIAPFLNAEPPSPSPRKPSKPRKSSSIASAAPFPVSPPKVILDQKGLEEQRHQSASFLKWIDPKKETKSPRLQVHIPDFSDQIHYLIAEKTFTHVPRNSILRLPTEGRAKTFFKSQKEIQGKTFLAAEQFVQEHQNQFEKVEADQGKPPAVLPESKDKIIILYSFSKIIVPH